MEMLVKRYPDFYRTLLSILKIAAVWGHNTLVKLLITQGWSVIRNFQSGWLYSLACIAYRSFIGLYNTNINCDKLLAVCCSRWSTTTVTAVPASPYTGAVPLTWSPWWSWYASLSASAPQNSERNSCCTCINAIIVLHIIELCIYFSKTYSNYQLLHGNGISI